MAKGPTRQMWKRMLIIMLVVILAGFGTTLGSLGNIMVVNADKYRRLAEEQQLRDTIIKAKRGTIYDRNMQVLATSATVWQVYVTPSDISNDKERELIATGLSSLLNVEKEKLINITKKKSGYETIGKPVELETADKIRKFISDNRLGAVIGLDETNKRYYPNDNLASTVLGFVGSDNQGLGGLEYQYNNTLTGTPGRVVAAKNAKGADMPFSYEKVIDAKNGDSLVLTIDEYIQHVAEKYLDQAVIQNKVTERGCILIMDVNTGGLLAMATKPDYNPNQPFEISDKAAKEAIEKLTGKEKTQAIASEQQAQWRNKAVSDTYEPGSVFKIITGSSALEEGKVSAKSTFECPGYIKIGDKTISCHKHGGHGHQTLEQAFQNSCNPAFISIGQNLGLKSFTDYRKSFGLQNMTGIDLPGESEPIYHPYSKMGSVELASESFGQSFKISPIQLITAISASVNGGYLYKPHLVKKVLDSNNNIVDNKEGSPIRQVISSDTSKQICGFLESVVANGTGRNAYIPGYKIGGKTGTSQKLDNKNDLARIASFCGIAPADDPKIAILMLLDEPHGPIISGGTNCAPMVGKIFEDVLPYMGVSPEYSEEDVKKLEINTPDVVGKKVTEAKSNVEKNGLKCTVIGSGGSVVRQVPSASQPVPKGGRVVIYTNNKEEKKMVKVPNFIGMTVSDANKAAADAALNIKFSGATIDATAYNQSITEKTEVESGTVITVDFREQVKVE